MTTDAQQLTDIYLKMLNSHDPDLVNEFVAVDYVNHHGSRRLPLSLDPPLIMVF